jgi:deoxyribonucleoside regulator
MHNLSDQHVSRLIEIARAYYLDNATQAEIGRLFGLSRSMVSRELSLAREIGIVTIHVHDPRTNLPSVEQRLCEFFPNLKHVIVTPTFSDDPDALRAMLGRFAANYLIQVVKPGQRLVLGCGRTLRSMFDSVPRQSVASVEIVQAMGNLGHEAHGIDYNEIARHAADALGGRVYYVSAPAILGDKTSTAQDFCKANPSVAQALSMVKHAQVMVVGIGSLESNRLYVKAGLLEGSELDTVHETAVGDICGRFFDRTGHEVVAPFSERVVGTTLDDLKTVNIRIGVAGGSDKVSPLIAALRGEYLNVLVSDEATIRMMIEYLVQESATDQAAD